MYTHACLFTNFCAAVSSGVRRVHVHLVWSRARTHGQGQGLVQVS